MTRSKTALLLLLLSLGASAAPSADQPAKTITVRMLDTRSGKLIVSSDFLVRIDHQTTVHGDWIKLNEEGTARLTLPADATALSVRATYDSNTHTYINCDVDKARPSAERDTAADRWYSVADILTLGVVAPNNCIGKKVPDKLQVMAHPGEFIFFVRPRNGIEAFKE
jgi:hypothetical protein